MTPEQETLVTSNIGLAGFDAKQYYIPGFEYQDLFQLACKGLCRAAIQHQEGRGALFSTYAVMCMRSDIMREKAHARYKINECALTKTIENTTPYVVDLDEQMALDELAMDIIKAADIPTLEIIIRKSRGMNNAQIAQELQITERDIYNSLNTLRRVVAV